MKKRTLIASAALLALQLSACSQKDSSNPMPVTPVAPTLIGTWQVIDYEADRPVFVFDTITTNVWAALPACAKDDLYIFKTGDTMQYNQGNWICSPLDSTLSTGTWFKNNQTLTINVEGMHSTMTILKLTADTLLIVGPSYSTNGQDTFRFIGTQTFKRL